MIQQNKTSSINQSIDHSTTQSINQSISQSVNQSVEEIQVIYTIPRSLTVRNRLSNAASKTGTNSPSSESDSVVICTREKIITSQAISKAVWDASSRSISRPRRAGRLLNSPSTWLRCPGHRKKRWRHSRAASTTAMSSTTSMSSSWEGKFRPSKSSLPSGKSVNKLLMACKIPTTVALFDWRYWRRRFKNLHAKNEPINSHDHYPINQSINQTTPYKSIIQSINQSIRYPGVPCATHRCGISKAKACSFCWRLHFTLSLRVLNPWRESEMEERMIPVRRTEKKTNQSPSTRTFSSSEFRRCMSGSRCSGSRSFKGKKFPLHKSSEEKSTRIFLDTYVDVIARR